MVSMSISDELIIAGSLCWRGNPDGSSDGSPLSGSHAIDADYNMGLGMASASECGKIN